MVLSWQQRDDGLAVNQAEKRNFRSIEERLQQHRIAGGKDGVYVSAGSGTVRGDHHALATGKAIVFDYKLWAEAVERGLNVFLGRTWA